MSLLVDTTFSVRVPTADCLGPRKLRRGGASFPVLAGSAAPLVTVVNATSMLTSDQKRGQVLIHDIIGKVKY